MIKNIFKFDDGSLSSQGPFKLSIILPMIISIGLCIPLWFKTEFNFSSEGYNNFLDLYKLPIAVLSLSIPLAAITSHIHRTFQTASQINITNKKNDADRFFSHQKFIIDNLKELKSKDFTFKSENDNLSIETPASLYRKLFPLSSHINGINTTGHAEFIEGVQRHLKNISQLISSYREMIKSEKHYSNAFHLQYEFLVLLDIDVSFIKQKLSLKSTLPHTTKNRKAIFKHDGLTYKIITKFHDEQEIKEYLLTLIFMITHILEIVSHEELDDEYTSEIYKYANDDNLLIVDTLLKATINENKIPMFLKEPTNESNNKDYSMYEYILRG